MSRSLEDFTSHNKINLLHEDQLRIAKSYLRGVQSKAPVITISFATEPQMEFTNKLARWLRLNIHPEVLLRIGLMPDLVAGCVVRTTSKNFDFSIRQLLSSKQDMLRDLITASVEGRNG
jgi:F0F1-type ATP synthase delta subunit